MDDTEEALNRQLENLERLMVSLDISGKSQETYDDKSEDNNQIIYDFCKTPEFYFINKYFILFTS
jgi:hypothetical protein